MDNGKVSVHGKDYSTVALRIKEFRAAYPLFGIKSHIIQVDDVLVIIKATITDESDRIVAEGTAEEVRKASNINRTSAVENCETSAVGRALANFGYLGTQVATQDEINNAIRTGITNCKTPAELTKYWKSLKADQHTDDIKEMFSIRKQQMEQAA